MKTKKNFSIIGMILGAAIIAFAVIMLFTHDIHPDATYLSKLTFGGDYYTEQYNATRVAAAELEQIGWNMRNLFEYSCFLLMGFGGLIVCYFGVKLGEATSTQSKTATALDEKTGKGIIGMEGEHNVKE